MTTAPGAKPDSADAAPSTALLEALRSLTYALREVTAELRNGRGASVAGLPSSGRLLTVPEAAVRLRCSDDSVRQLIRGKRLKASKPGRAYVISEHAIEAFLEAPPQPLYRRRRRRTT